MHTHRWRQVHEEALLGGSYRIGWECVDCKAYVSNGDVTPAGLGGVVLEKAARLVGPHGCRSQCTDGSTYKEQIVDEDGHLSIIR